MLILCVIHATKHFLIIHQYLKTSENMQNHCGNTVHSTFTFIYLGDKYKNMDVIPRIAISPKITYFSYN
jgi:hypothetical protein